MAGFGATELVVMVGFGVMELVVIGFVLWGIFRLKERTVQSRPGEQTAPRPVHRRVHGSANGNPAPGWLLPMAVIFFVLMIMRRGGAIPIWTVFMVLGGFWIARYCLRQADTSHGDSHSAPIPEEVQTPQPTPRRPEAVRHATPLAETQPHSPSPNRYPHEPENIAWLFCRSAAMIVLFVAGAAFLLISSTELRPALNASQIAERMFPSVRGSAEKKAPLIFAKAEAVQTGDEPKDTVKNAVVPEGTTFQAQDMLAFPGVDDRKFTFYSHSHSQLADADLELLNRISQFLVLALESTTSVIADDWSPGVNWVARDMVTYRQVQKDSGSSPESSKAVTTSLGEATTPSAAVYRVRMDVELSPERLDYLYKRFSDDRSQARSVMLAKLYAGAVMMLGGMAIFMRLGTGRRPELPIGAGHGEPI